MTTAWKVGLAVQDRRIPVGSGGGTTFTDKLLSRTLSKERKTCSEWRPLPKLALTGNWSAAGAQPGRQCLMWFVRVQSRVCPVIVKMTEEEHRCFQGLLSS